MTENIVGLALMLNAEAIATAVRTALEAIPDRKITTQLPQGESKNLSPGAKREALQIAIQEGLGIAHRRDGKQMTPDIACATIARLQAVNSSTGLWNRLHTDPIRFPELVASLVEAPQREMAPDATFVGGITPLKNPYNPRGVTSLIRPRPTLDVGADEPTTPRER